jgi:murein DD-endopeptidase MepM/ murein hydrolase activator NlpD
MTMRHMLLAAALLFVASGCSRQVYSAPEPVSGRAPAASSAAAPVITRSNVTSAEAVSYLLGRGILIPVAGATVSQLYDSFDEGRDGVRVHRAIDIMAPRGTPVLAADDGRVIRVSASTLGGNTIYATDPLGRVVYYYAHLDAYQPGLASGATVARGDTLGFVGTTGNAPKDTPHLHFQVMRMPPDGKYWDGDPINPFPLILLTHDAVRP